MKRYIYTLLACACVLFGFVVKAEAQIQDGDIITIRSGDNYLAVNGNSFDNVTTLNKGNIERCLWKVTKEGEQYAFQNVAESDSYLRVNATRSGNSWTIRLVIGNLDNATAFTWSNSKLSYKATSNNNRSTTCYIRCTSNWNGTTWSWGAGNTDDNNTLTLEKWELREEAGGLKGVFEPNEIEAFGLAETDTRETRTVEFKVSRTSSERYYQCLAADKKIILEGGEEDNSPIEFYREVSFRWKNGQTTAYASCANYENASVTNRALMQVTWEKHSTKAYTWVATITAIGSSPMEMKDGDKWTDYVNDLIAEFITDGGYSTHRFSTPVTRKSYHREVLPEFEVKFDPSTIEFPRDGGTTTINVTCTHQHGYLIRHMYGNVDDNSYDEEHEPYVTVQETFNATPSFVTFEAKKVEDETASDWLTVVGLNDGVLTLSAHANTNTQRHARLVGIFNYTNSGDASDKHVKTIVLDVTQRIKDGNVVLLPNKGHSGEAFGKNPYSGLDEQQVHTVNKTIYYTPNQDQIELRLPETAFRGYMRPPQGRLPEGL